MGARIKKGDMVIVIAGKDADRKATGKVVEVRDDGRLIVEGVNIVKRHTKPNQKDRMGGIIDKPAPIQASNVMLLEVQTGKGTRVRMGKNKDGKKVRVSVSSGKVLD